MTLREHLQKELVTRYGRNPRYSLRAFARSLEIEPSALSKILRGKRRLTPKMQSRIVVRLGMTPEVVGQFEPEKLTRVTPPSVATAAPPFLEQ